MLLFCIRMWVRFFTMSFFTPFCKNVDRVQITNQDCVHFAILLGV